MGPHAYGAGSGQHARDRHHPGKLPGLVDLCPLLQRPPFSTPPSPISKPLSKGYTGNFRGERVVVDVEPMSILNDRLKGRPTVNGPLLATIAHRWALAAAFIELVGPRPGEAAGGALGFSRAYRLIEGIPAASNVPARHLTLATWKRQISLLPEQDSVNDMARAEARRRWVTLAKRFSANGSDGLAAAAFVAVAGMAREARR